MSKEREHICTLINKVELNYPVTEWMHNGYHIWPVLRIPLYMYLVKKNENNRRGSRKKKASRFRQIQQILNSISDFVFINNNIKDIYVGAPSHSVSYKGQEYNRYFDPLMDAKDGSSLYLSKSQSKGGVYKPERHLSYTNLLFIYRALDRLFNIFSNTSPYVDELREIIKELECNIEGFQNKVNSFLKTVDVSYALSLALLKRIKPKEISVLCYYSADVMGLLIAAHKLSIPTVDMQHGGHGKNHLAYSSWKEVPLTGYEALPNFFYTWDDASAKNINSWAQVTEKHMAKKFGNPWVEGWKNSQFSDTKFKWPENIILYTLQPIGEPLEPYLLETIVKTKHKWNWWLRLHPRQMDEIEDIKLRLSKYDLLDEVNIEDATKLPLPEILMHTQVHLTKFSGCAIEAYQFGIPTILIDEKGIDTYDEYVEPSHLMCFYLKKRSIGLIKEISNQFFYVDKKNN